MCVFIALQSTFVCLLNMVEKKEKCKSGLAKEPIGCIIGLLSLDNNDKNYELIAKHYNHSKLGDLIHKYSRGQKSDHPIED